MKKLIPALCMLLVAACLMGTSTYAWFAASESVTASGMSVQAISDGGLAIATYKAGTTPQAPGEADFKSAVTFNATTDWKNGDATIRPTSWNGTNWVAGTSATSDSAAAHTLTTLGTDYADLAGYMQHTKWAIKSLKEGATVKVGVSTIEVKAGTDGNSASLNKALRVGIKAGSNWYIFAPAYDTTAAATLTYVASFTTKTDAEGNTVVDVVTPGSTNIKGGTSYTNTAVLFGALGTTAQEIDVYLYYEGQDDNCKTAFATDISTLSVEIGYAVVE